MTKKIFGGFVTAYKDTNLRSFTVAVAVVANSKAEAIGKAIEIARNSDTLPWPEYQRHTADVVAVTESMTEEIQDARDEA